MRFRLQLQVALLSLQSVELVADLLQLDRALREQTSVGKLGLEPRDGRAAGIDAAIDVLQLVKKVYLAHCHSIAVLSSSAVV